MKEQDGLKEFEEYIEHGKHEKDTVTRHLNYFGVDLKLEKPDYGDVREYNKKLGWKNDFNKASDPAFVLDLLDKHLVEPTELKKRLKTVEPEQFETWDKALVEQINNIVSGLYASEDQNEEPEEVDQKKDNEQ